MDRREFFRSALRRGAKTVVDHAEEKVEQEARRWIRPPFAIKELDFLLSCSRCGDCVQACPHEVIFPLSARLGAKVVGTPALDLLSKGCHLCEEWPCVQACGEPALSLPELEDAIPSVEHAGTRITEAADRLLPPKMAQLAVNIQTCLPYQGPECGACNNSCPVPGALTFEGTRPVINDQLCVGCGLCREACIVDPAAITVRTERDDVEMGANGYQPDAGESS